MITANMKPAINLERPSGNDLAKCPSNNGGIPGLKMAVMDSGASAICMKSKDSFLVDNHEELQKPISLGGIVSGL